MPNSVALTIGGHAMVALADRALFWPARSRLILSDLHLGKADTFRRLGMALPSGGTKLDLERLSALIAQTGAREVWVLGDFLHGAVVPSWRQQWLTWRSENSALDIGVLTGNHDASLHSASLAITPLGAVVNDAGLAFRHAPDQDPGGQHVLCGHLHPVIRLPGLGGRWPIFWLGERQTVLPAFSRFTGGMEINVVDAGQFVACVATEVVASWGTKSRGR